MRPIVPVMKHTMKEFTYKVTDPEGFHARPAGQLVKFAQGLDSEVTVSLDGRKADARKIFAVMGLCVKQDNVITVSVSGGSEETNTASLKAFFEKSV